MDLRASLGLSAMAQPRETVVFSGQRAKNFSCPENVEHPVRFEMRNAAMFADAAGYTRSGNRGETAGDWSNSFAFCRSLLRTFRYEQWNCGQIITKNELPYMLPHLCIRALKYYNVELNREREPRVCTIKSTYTYLLFARA